VGSGGIKNPVSNILVQGLRLTQTTNANMRDRMVPSGGDWSVHRGRIIYLTNTKKLPLHITYL
jgi:hypothetical protein